MGRAFQYVILGGGTAAGYAALEFVKRGVQPGELCIISEEEVAPYERPALSKGYLMPEAGAVRLPTFHTCVGIGGERQVPRWYKEKGIELILGVRVTHVDVKARKLTTSKGETIIYNTLIAATGARVLRLEEFGVTGADASNICYLRNIHDADALVAAMARCRGQNAVVIGGGYIGMECTAALVLNGIRVTIVFPEPHCMARLFTPSIAEFYEAQYAARGVQFVKGTVMSALDKDANGKVTAIILKGGQRLPCDMVVVGVGIRASTSLFEGQLAIEKGGLRVDGHFRTSNPHVYAVGDVSAFPVKMYGDMRRLEHVDHARRSAVHAVASILSPTPVGDYDYLPYFYSRVFNLSWQFYGDNVGECIVVGSMERRKFGAFWLHKGHVVGTFYEGGTPEEYAAMARLARLQPAADATEIARQGVGFAVRFLDPALQGALTSSAAEAARMLVASESSTMALQVGAGLAVAVGITVFAYWYGRRQKRW